jgi:hypothetical protein
VTEKTRFEAPYGTVSRVVKASRGGEVHGERAKEAVYPGLEEVSETQGGKDGMNSLIYLL